MEIGDNKVEEKYILRSMILWFLVNYIWVYFRSREEPKNIVKTPRVLSILLGAPIGVGRMPIADLLYGTVNIVSFFSGALVYLLMDKTLGGAVFAILWLVLAPIVVLYDAIKYKD